MLCRCPSKSNLRGALATPNRPRSKDNIFTYHDRHNEPVAQERDGSNDVIGSSSIEGRGVTAGKALAYATIAESGKKCPCPGGFRRGTIKNSRHLVVETNSMSTLKPIKFGNEFFVAPLVLCAFGLTLTVLKRLRGLKQKTKVALKTCKQKQHDPVFGNEDMAEVEDAIGCPEHTLARPETPKTCSTTSRDSPAESSIASKKSSRNRETADKSAKLDARVGREQEGEEDHIIHDSSTLSTPVEMMDSLYSNSSLSTMPPILISWTNSKLSKQRSISQSNQDPNGVYIPARMPSRVHSFLPTTSGLQHSPSLEHSQTLVDLAALPRVNSVRRPLEPLPDHVFQDQARPPIVSVSSLPRSVLKSLSSSSHHSPRVAPPSTVSQIESILNALRSAAVVYDLDAYMSCFVQHCSFVVLDDDNQSSCWTLDEFRDYYLAPYFDEDDAGHYAFVYESVYRDIQACEGCAFACFEEELESPLWGSIVVSGVMTKLEEQDVLGLDKDQMFGGWRIVHYQFSSFPTPNELVEVTALRFGEESD